MTAENATSQEMTELEWITLQKEITNHGNVGLPKRETMTEKFVRKFKQNPVVPIGKIYNFITFDFEYYVDFFKQNILFQNVISNFV